MALNLSDKKNIVAQINETANQSLSLVIADARGVDVSDMNALRSQARKENIELKVVRNTSVSYTHLTLPTKCSV